MDSEDGGEAESEEETGMVNPYPLEGKYKDETDRQRWVYAYFYDVGMFFSLTA
jgi:hypothetical protein